MIEFDMWTQKRYSASNDRISFRNYDHSAFYLYCLCTS